MGADIKSLRNRIKSVRSTSQLTNAMGLVASSKIRRAQEARVKSQQYASALSSVVDVLTLSQECKKSPYITSQGGKVVKVVVIAGDRGLAGGYNANVFRYVRDMGEVDVYPIGKKACDKYGAKSRSSERFSYGEAHELAKELCREFLDGKYEKIGIVYTRYVSMITQEPNVTWLFPLTGSEAAEATDGGAVFEPDEITILENAVPVYVAGLIYEATREAFACEVVARRNAMDSAGKNAAAMIDTLQLQYNRARQGAITQEITEIVAGSGE